MRIQLRFNQPISIRLPRADGAWHSGVVLNHTEDREMVIGMPATLAEAEPPEPGTEVDVELALPDGLRRFTVHVRGVGDAPPSLKLSWPQEGERIQRRDAVRVPVQMRADVRVVQRDGSLGPTLLGQTSDVSAGGVRINLPEPLEAESRIEIALQAPGIGTMECAGRVLRGGELQAVTGANRHWVAVIFSDLPPAVLRDINRMVLDVQRTLMRRSAL